MRLLPRAVLMLPELLPVKLFWNGRLVDCGVLLVNSRPAEMLVPTFTRHSDSDCLLVLT